MKKIEIKHKFTNEVLFSHECENNTIKRTLELAVKNRANLECAYLECAYLENANLENANLKNANLEYANLENAYLVNANLVGANLGSANLECAYLVNANLGSANLGSAKKIPIYCKWTHGITDGNLIHVGCEKRTIEEWDKFFSSDEKLTTERNTPEFKQIEAVYLAYKAYLTHLNS